LKRAQISLWLANTRRKHRARENDKRTSAAFPAISGTTSAKKTFEELTPFDRWKVIPDVFVPQPVIWAACEENPLKPATIQETTEPAERVPSVFGAEQSTANFSQYDAFFAQSLASYETGLTSILEGQGGSSISGLTTFSYGSARPKHGPERRRRRTTNHKATPKPAGNAKSRPFQCTFCPDSTFATKHDWQRHEKSQHLSLESWVCCPSGGTITTASGPVCAFCSLPNPSTEHLETHNFSACQLKERSERTFYRKDHFQQHLRLTHECKLNPLMSAWREEITDVKSRCGFCSAQMQTWSQRADHLASHFKCRATMQDWVGDWGFESHIAAMVEKAPIAALLLEPLAPKGTVGKGFQQGQLMNLPPVPLFDQGIGGNSLGGVDDIDFGLLDGNVGVYDPALADLNNGMLDPLMDFGTQPFVNYANLPPQDWMQFQA
jgi:hypothetical protein